MVFFQTERWIIAILWEVETWMRLEEGQSTEEEHISVWRALTRRERTPMKRGRLNSIYLRIMLNWTKSHSTADCVCSYVVNETSWRNMLRDIKGI